MKLNCGEVDGGLFLESFANGVLNCACGEWKAEVAEETSLDTGRNSRPKSPDTGDAIEKLGGEFDDNDLRIGLEVTWIPDVLKGFEIKEEL